MTQRILVVEDDESLGEVIVEHLRLAGYEPVRWREGHHVHPDHPPDVALVILDLMLPHVGGYTLLEELRAASDVPVLVLSGRADVSDRTRALQLGADDYLVKPFWPEELIERVRARLRRPVLRRQDILEVGAVKLDTASRSVWVGGEPVHLTPVEYELLLALALRPGATVARRWLVANLLAPDSEPSERVLDVHVSRLRKKIGPGLVETVRGVGYRLVAP